MSVTAWKSRPGGNQGGIQEVPTPEPSIPDSAPGAPVSPLAPALSQVATRMLQETIAAALPFTWDRRAEQLESCRPRPGDFTGRQSDADRDARLAAQAQSCRDHARFLRAYPSDIFEMFRDDVLTLMGEERIFLEREAPQMVRAGKDLVREAQDVIDLLRGVA